MSIRELTKQQFSDGTTIDGSRLSKALDDTDERFDKVPGGDIAQRHTQTQIVCGWSPATATSGTSKTSEIQYPWLKANNPNQQTSPYANKSYRFKSTGETSSGTSAQYAMTVPFQSFDPVIIQSVNVIMTTNDDGYYKWDPSDFGTDNLGPQLLISVDHPFLTEDANMSSVSLHKDYGSVDAFDLTAKASDAGITPASDMAPALSNIALRGAYLKTEDLNIPLPSNARLRLSLLNVNDSSESYSMWAAFSLSYVVTILEPLTNV